MHDFVEGDRVRYVGPPQPGSGEPAYGIPDLMPGEEGWIIDLYEPARVCVVSWDRYNTVDMEDTSDLEWLGRNEPDGSKRGPES